MYLSLLIAAAWQEPFLGHTKFDLLSVLFPARVEVPVSSNGDDTVVSKFGQERVNGVGNVV